VDAGDSRPEAILDDLGLDSPATVEVADVIAYVFDIPVTDSTIGKRPLAEIVESLDQQLRQAR
jgi:acyl carrier protein